MPHVSVKIVGKTEQEKADLAKEITRAVMSVARCEERAVSVSIEDVEKDRWIEDVYRPDILDKWDSLYKKPGYDPLSASGAGGSRGRRSGNGQQGH